MQNMTPNQPYLLRAFFDWIIDNELTPYVVIDVSHPNVKVPTQFVSNGQIVLNLSPSACVNFTMDLEWVEFQARFSGQPMTVSFPIAAVSAIYAKENGAGTVFTVPQSTSDDDLPEDVETAVEESNAAKLTLKSVKNTADSTDDSDDTPPTNPPTKPTKKPGLRIVK